MLKMFPKDRLSKTFLGISISIPQGYFFEKIFTFLPKIACKRQNFGFSKG